MNWLKVAQDHFQWQTLVLNLLYIYSPQARTISHALGVRFLPAKAPVHCQGSAWRFVVDRVALRRSSFSTISVLSCQTPFRQCYISMSSSLSSAVPQVPGDAVWPPACRY